MLPLSIDRKDVLIIYMKAKVSLLRLLFYLVVSMLLTNWQIALNFLKARCYVVIRFNYKTISM